MQRLLTAAVALPLALAAVFLLSDGGLFLVALLVMEWGAFEFVRLARRWAPTAPLGALLLLVPLGALALAPEVLTGSVPQLGPEHLLAAGALISVGLGSLVLLARTPIAEAVVALGTLSFGLPYFVLPTVAIYRLKVLDSWTLFLLFAVVWLGDSAAYYIGTRWGRHRLAPVVSPKKSWEGAAASLAAALLGAALWSLWRLGHLSVGLLAVAAVVSVAAQVGDLVESMLKRAAGVKDSGNLLPGHGGVLDRVDALMFAAPVLLVGLWLVGYEVIGR